MIDAPLPTLTWKVDDLISFSGSATDPQDGDAAGFVALLDPSAAPLPLRLPPPHGDRRRRASLAAPDHEYPSHLELKLTATDSRASRRRRASFSIRRRSR